MRILVMDGQGGDGLVALVERRPAGLHRVGQAVQPGRGGATRLAGLLRDLMAGAGWDLGSLGLIVAITGPGSFTGLRATLALAHGIALGNGTPLQGVTGGEALRRMLHGDPADAAPSLPLWYVVTARRDRVFLDRPGHDGPEAFMLDEFPVPGAPVRLAGDGASLVVARIEAACGTAVLSGIARPDACAVAAVGLDRLEGRLAPLAALPLYVDPPEAKWPAAGLRPSPS